MPGEIAGRSIGIDGDIKEILEVARRFGLDEEDINLYGKYKAKINKKGLEPDILVELSETSIVDTQLEEAIKILEKESE